MQKETTEVVSFCTGDMEVRMMGPMAYRLIPDCCIRSNRLISRRILPSAHRFAKGLKFSGKSIR